MNLAVHAAALAQGLRHGKLTRRTPPQACWATLSTERSAHSIEPTTLSALRSANPEKKKGQHAVLASIIWCPGEDSNLHGVTR
jgi:hypothetical protein